MVREDTSNEVFMKLSRIAGTIISITHTLYCSNTNFVFVLISSFPILSPVVN